MKKFLFVVSFVLLSQVTLAEEVRSGSHIGATTPQSAPTTSPPPAVEKQSRLFEYVSACLAGRGLPPASPLSAATPRL